MSSGRARPLHQLVFRSSDLALVVEHMTKISRAGDGWINLVPEGVDEDRPTTLRFATLFGGDSSGITMGTWVREPEGRTGQSRTRLGIAHLSGRRAGRGAAALSFPEGWTLEQDHPRRGLVLRVPSEEPHAEVLSWALHAVETLGSLGHLERWRAEVYGPPGGQG